ncbi:hypothetical protein [Halostella litorea]|uniref:hypothetical protein n=1 Tax=Halostella litorea TaxID=2528831 RepID=UPI001386D99F|nr:hypothetical protein [Halostella litorea]
MSPASSRRRVLSLAAGVLTAGCTTGPGFGSATDATTTPSTATDAGSPATDTTTAEPPTSTFDSTRHAGETPDPDHEISVRNEQSRERSVRVTVVREATGGTVFERTVDVAAGATRSVYNLKRADPDGVERFEVCGSLVGGSGDSGSDCVTIATSECYADAEITVRESGEVRVIYAVC